MALFLLAAIGTGPYSPRRFRLGDALSPPLSYSPVALQVLLRQNGKEVGGVVVLATEQAEKRHRRTLEEEARTEGLDPSGFRWARIPEAAEERDLWQVLEVVREELEGLARGKGLERVPLVVDITHGFRHLPFTVLSALRYLDALGRVEVQGVYYGLFLPEGEEEPLVDLRPLLEVDRWSFLAGLRRVTGTLRAWGDLLQGAGMPKGLAANLGPRLEALEEVLLLGHAPAVGRKAAEALEKGRGKPLRALEEQQPLLAPLLSRALEEFSPFQGRAEALTEEELERECRLVRWYLDHGLLTQALLLAREVMVNRVLLAGGRTGAWLERDARRWAEARLWGDKRAQGRAGGLWDGLCHLRNRVAHCGFSKAEAPSPEEVRRTVEEALDLLEDPSAWSWVLRSQEGRLLISPLGMSPGLLYTALRQASREAPLHGLVVIPSRETEGRLGEVLERAGFKGEVLPLTVEATRFPTKGECEALWRRVQEWPPYRDAGSALLNIAGGTEAMQYLARFLAERMEGDGLDLEVYWAVDPRPWKEQQEDPFGAVGCWEPLPRWSLGGEPS